MFQIYHANVSNVRRHVRIEEAQGIEQFETTRSALVMHREVSIHSEPAPVTCVRGYCSWVRARFCTSCCPTVFWFDLKIFWERIKTQV